MVYPILDMNNNVVIPTVVLCHRNKHKIGAIYPISEWSITPDMYNKNECSFKVYKEVNGIATPLWDQIKDLKVIYIPEYNEYFQISIDKTQTNETVKTITGSNLGIAELSQTMLYDIEINTEDDIARDAYKMAYIYDPTDVSNSLLGRILSKAPHYKIKHVDASLCKLVRAFSISDKSIYDFLTGDLADELNCLVWVDSYDRSISIYDLENSCPKCGRRAENETVCSECGTTMTKGYGKYFTVPISNDNLSDSITLKTKDDEVKNTFRVQGGDDTITAAIRAVNPNGSNYINNFQNFQLEDMSTELVTKIKSYQDLYNSYKKQYKDLMNKIYESIDRILYLQSEMMPNVDTDETDANKELAKLTAKTLGTISVQKLSTTGLTTANNAVKSVAKIYISAGYTIDIASSTYSSGKWKGKFKVTSVDDEEDTATNTTDIQLIINENYENFIQQKLKKILAQKSISDDELYDWTKYSLNRLSSFSDAYQSCLDVLTEMGVGNKTHEFYKTIYLPYYNKKLAIDKEIKVREQQITLEKAKQKQNEALRDEIQNKLNFEKYLGDLYSEYCLYRREDTYQNDNYISDGLSNSEILAKAEELLEVAQKEIIKASDLQVDLSTDVGNIWTIDEFKDVLNQWKCGNWIRVICDNDIYKLRLLNYTIKDSDFSKISCNFSSATKLSNGIMQIKDILDSAKSMASSFDSIKRQAKHAEDTKNTVNDWVNDGLDLTAMSIKESDNQNLTYDNHGLTARQYDDITGDYEPEQLKIVNNALAVTDDNWNTIKTAIGKFYYPNPENPDEIISAYGLIGETIVGKLLLGEALGIYNDGGTLKFDKNGLLITNGTNSFSVNPNSDKLLVLSKSESDLLYVDKEGMLHLYGDGSGIDLTSNKAIEGVISTISALSDGMVLKVNSNGEIAQIKLSGDPDHGTLVKIGAKNINLTASETIDLLSGGNIDLTGKNIKIKSTNFNVDKDGNATVNKLTATNGNFSGKITSSEGTIGGFKITSSQLYDDNKELSSGIGKTGASHAFWAGAANNDTTNAPFRVSHSGALYSSNATIESASGDLSTKIADGKLSFTCKGYTPSTISAKISSDKVTNIDFITSGILHINGTQQVDLQSYNNVVKVYVNENRNFVTNTTWGLDVTGGLIVDSSVVSSSDENKKYDISELDINQSSDFIYSLVPKQFKYKNGSSHRLHHGFIAQDVKKSMQNQDWGVYIDDADSGKGLRYEEIIADLVAVVQSQKQELIDLNNRISELEKRGEN